MGGAVIAGLAYGSAGSIPEAFDRMRGHGLPAAAASAAAVLQASGHQGRWPSVSIWHGDADPTVAAANADALVAQWAGVHGLKARPDEVRHVARHTHRLWRGPAGDIVLEDIRIAGMGHGVPVDSDADEPCGAAGPYLLEVGLSASLGLVTRWDLARADVAAHAPPPSTPGRERARTVTVPVTPVGTAPRPPAGAVQEIIEAALRRAGLLR